MSDRKNTYIDGNAAYDIKSFGGMNVVREREYVLPQEPQQQPKKQVRVVKARSRVPVVSLMGFTACTVLLMLVIFSYVRLYEVSATNSQLQNQLESISDSNALMKNQYSNIIDLNAVELIATNQLGMSRPAKEQMVYVDLGNSDKAVIIESSGDNVFNSVAAVLTDSLQYILEYFSVG